MARSNDGLPSLAVSRAMLATAPGRKKLELILDSPDPQLFVQRLPAEDVYFAIKELGLADAAEIIALASPEQFQTFLDLDVWHGHLPSPDRVLLWLQLLHEGASSVSNFRELRRGIDPELMLLLLKTRTLAHELEEGVDPVLTSDNWVRTAEGKYLVEIHAEGDQGAMLRRLIEDFIDENPFEATRLFEAVLWEQKSELEETALRWRTGRLRDIGFPELEEAIRIWAPLPADWKPRESLAASGPVAGVPALLLSSTRENLFLDRVTEKLPDDDRPRFNEGLIYLLNCALVADGIDPKELDFARGTLQSTRDMLSLGLEITSEGDEDRALRILATTPAAELFRFTVTQLTELARKARKAADPLRFGTGSLISIDSPESEILSGVQRRRPTFFDPPKDGEKREEGPDFRAFRTPADLAAVEQSIAIANLYGHLLSRLGIDGERFRSLADEAGRAVSATTANQAVTTAAVRVLLDEEPAATPLSKEELESLARHFEDGRLSDSASKAFDEALTKLAEGESAPGLPTPELAILPYVIERTRQSLNEEIGSPVAAGSLDPRFIECLLIASPETGDAPLPEES